MVDPLGADNDCCRQINRKIDITKIYVLVIKLLIPDFTVHLGVKIIVVQCFFEKCIYSVKYCFA